MELHEKLIRLRKQKGMSQLELAEALEVSRQAISKWEVGSAVPSTENLRGLSNLYGRCRDFGLERKGGRESGEREGKKAEGKKEKKEGKNIQKGRQIMYTGVRENNNQKHERRRPKCGISNEETVNPHEESISNSPENQGADRPSRKKADIPRGSGNSGAGHADTTV